MKSIEDDAATTKGGSKRGGKELNKNQ